MSCIFGLEKCGGLRTKRKHAEIMGLIEAHSKISSIVYGHVSRLGLFVTYKRKSSLLNCIRMVSLNVYQLCYLFYQ